MYRFPRKRPIYNDTGTVRNNILQLSLQGLSLLLIFYILSFSQNVSVSSVQSQTAWFLFVEFLTHVTFGFPTNS